MKTPWQLSDINPQGSVITTTYILQWINDVSPIQLLTNWRSSNVLNGVVTEQLSVCLTANLRCRADWPWRWPPTHNFRYLHPPIGLHQLSYTCCTQRPPIVRLCSPAGGWYVGPPMAMSNMLHNIQTDATLTSLPGSPHKRRWHWDGIGVCLSKQRIAWPVNERILAEAKKPVCIIHVHFYFPHQQQWKVILLIIHECVLYARFYVAFYLPLICSTCLCVCFYELQKMFSNRPGLFNNANTSFGKILLLVL